MAYTLDIALNLGSGQTSLTLSAQLVDTVGVNVGSAVTAGFVEVGLGNYLWHYASFPDNFRGGVTFTAAAVLKAFVAVNPEALIQTVTAGSGTAYVSLSEMRLELGISVVGDTTDDVKLTHAALAASRAVDNETGRFFYLDTDASARYYTTEDGDYLRVDDIGSATSFAIATDDDGDRTYETTWAATDYDLEPYNAAAKSQPWTVLHTTPNGAYYFSRQRKGCKITAKWGWPSVPADIKRAAMIEAVRLYKRRDSPFGVTGSADMGFETLPSLDPDVKRLLAPYRKMGIGGV